MSWGSWILLLVYPVLAAAVLLEPPARLVRLLPAIGPLSQRLADDLRVRRALGFVSMATGIGLGIYTGILLSALGARPLWSSGLLGPLFLASGLSSSAAFAHWASPEPEERRQMAWLDNLLPRDRARPHRHAPDRPRLLDARPTPRPRGSSWAAPSPPSSGSASWGSASSCPSSSSRSPSPTASSTRPIAPILVMLGGLALRFVIVYAGQYSHWPRLS